MSLIRLKRVQTNLSLFAMQLCILFGTVGCLSYRVNESEASAPSPRLGAKRTATLFTFLRRSAYGKPDANSGQYEEHLGLAVGTALRESELFSKIKPVDGYYIHDNAKAADYHMALNINIADDGNALLDCLNLASVTLIPTRVPTRISVSIAFDSSDASRKTYTEQGDLVTWREFFLLPVTPFMGRNRVEAGMVHDMIKSILRQATEDGVIK
jgi:hypothetical protein